MEETRQHYGLTLGILTLAATAYALQQTMVVPALPELQRELDASTTWVTWVLTGFLLSAAVLTPILGKLGDRFGKERLLVFSLATFLVGCIGCAAAPDIWTLIAFRIVSGAAGAVFPLSFGIIRDEFPPDRMKVGIGLLSATFGVGRRLRARALGRDRRPRQLALAVRRRRDRRRDRARPRAPLRARVARPVDLAHRRPRRRPSLRRPRHPAPRRCPRARAGAGRRPPCSGCSRRRPSRRCSGCVLELHVDQPLIDIRVLAERPVLLTNVTALISGFAMFGSFVLVPRFVETPGDLPAGIAAQVDYGFGASATTTGLYLLPGSLLMLFAGPAAGLLGRRVGSKWPLAIGMSLIAVSAATLAVLHDEPWQVVVAMAGLSIGVGFAFAAMAALITEAVEPTETGIATGINTVMRTVGAVVGAQVGAAILTAQTLGGTGVPTEGAYVSAFVLAAAAAAVATAIAVFVTPATRRGRRAAIAVEAG